MINVRAEMEARLSWLRKETASNFSALAWIAEDGRSILWKYADGNQNERYKQMLGRAGRGLSGTVMRYGRLMLLDATTPQIDEVRLQYPIMLAEDLHAAAAAPVFVYGETRGVLLIGHRSSRRFTENEIQLLLETAKQLASVNKETRYNEPRRSM